MELSKYSEMLKEAYRKGYRIIDNKIYSPYKKGFIKGYLNTGGTGRGDYRCFSVNYENKPGRVFVHRLVAFQKFHNKIFEEGMVVRHLDGNPLNNSEENIAIGTDYDNSMDRSKEDRIKHATKASLANRKFTDKEMKEIKEHHKKHNSYGKTMEKFNISSKGTLWYMLNKNYKTKV